MKEILDTMMWATIESYVPLWELPWELNNILPDKKGIENEKLAKRVVYVFFKAGLVEFYFNIWAKDHNEKIAESLVEDILMDEKYWKVFESSEDLYIAASSTQKGEDLYNNRILEFEPTVILALKDYINF